MGYHFRCELADLAKIVSNNRIRYCCTVLSEIKLAYPNSKFDEVLCSTHINLILDAVVSDLMEDSNFNIIQALTAYVKNSPRLTYKTQTKYLIYGIHILRNILISQANNNIPLIEWLIEKFSLIVNILNNNTIEEAKWWEFFGCSIPYVMLLILTILYYFDLDYWYHYTIFVVVVGFFSFSVMWWWWTISKIIVISMSFKNIKHSFVEIKQDLNKVKTQIK